jgi:hypothetical protein
MFHQKIIKIIKMYKIYSFTIVLLFLGIFGTMAQKKDIALGFRLGEPLAFSFKKYYNGGENAIEVNLGSYGYTGGYGNYKNGNYNGNYKYYNNYYYQKGGVVLMVDFLWHFDIPKLAALSWYAGAGGQMRTVRYLKANNTILEERSTVGIGPNGVIGLEWTPVQIPEISVFLDSGIYLEVVPQAWLNLQAGIGVRFNFQ